ncbi:hypothetical protein NFHSH190041_25220 [Shewanella sp. NFH-SH190041]|uniref:methyl-accepting chemotaxis protein n=1 Tax=Shewanella sp. NFH-SH190041 TaxID=2950245 RepID=UPI0021C33A69|nr:methyl-accepting chemotaxis protein [Shewanella sp. NFH-SH190041]BDM65070.1 hypothetical protein NFHSH190041_25220 [Shewanella sp. NFH-SH190041]
MNRILDISIRIKLWGIALLVIISGALILLSMTINLSQVDNKFTEYEKGAGGTERAVLSIKGDMNDFSRITRSILIGDDYNKNMVSLDKFHQTIPRYFEQLRESIEHISNESERTRLNQLANDAERDTQNFIQIGFDCMQVLAGQERTPEQLATAWQHYKLTAFPPANAALASFKLLAQAETSVRTQLEQGSKKELQDTRWDLSVLVLILFAIVTMAIAMLARAIVLPVQGMLSTINSIEQHSDLTQRIPELGKDELTALSIGFNRMLEKFQLSLQRASGMAQHLTQSAQETQSVTAAALVSIDNQKRELDMVATAMNEMTSTVVDVARNASAAAEATEESDSTAKEGNQVVAQTISSMQSLAAEVSGASDSVAELEQHSQQIQKILEVIQSIAEQTNLLALNAAIEAARAGEQGRGFAVVADEVRTLASRTQDSTEEIRAMINQLQQGALRTVEVMSRSREYSDDSVQCAEQAGNALDSITVSVAKINDMNLQIATAAEQQTAVAEEINSNIVSVHQGMSQSVAGAEQMNANALQLAQTANELAALVAEFKV